MSDTTQVPANYVEHFNKAYPLYFHSVCEDYPHITQVMHHWLGAPYVQTMIGVTDEDLRGRTVRAVTALHMCLNEQAFGYVLSTMGEIAIVAADSVIEQGSMFCSFSSGESFKHFFSLNIFRRILLHYAPTDPKGSRTELEKILGLEENEYGTLENLFPDMKNGEIPVTIH